MRTRTAANDMSTFLTGDFGMFLATLLIYVLTFGPLLRACTVYGTLPETVRREPVAILGRIVSIDRAPRGIQIGEDTAEILVEEVLKNSLDEKITPGSKLKLFMPSANDELELSADIHFQEDQYGYWILQPVDNGFRADFPDTFHPLNERDKVLRALDIAGLRPENPSLKTSIGKSQTSRYVLDRVECTNPGDVADLVFGSGAVRASDVEPLHLDFETRDLGDGTTVHVFMVRSPKVWWGRKPNLHFVEQGERLEILFDGRGKSTSYWEEGYKVNGRYMLKVDWWEDEGGTASPPREMSNRRQWFFWNGNDYIPFYTVDLFNQLDPPNIVGVNREALDDFRRARFTWEYEAEEGDTLEDIANRFCTTPEAIMKQNDLKESLILVGGRVLSFDSLKTEKGQYEILPPRSVE